jgi:chromosome segregation ATPase
MMRLERSKFWAANADADARIVECDRLRRDNAQLHEQADGLAQAYEALTDARDEALIRQQELHASLNDARTEVVRLQRQLEQARAVEDWHGVASGGLK